MFATPEGRYDAPASFAWRGVPAGWTVASDLDHFAGGRAGTVGDIAESAAIGAPDLVVITRQVGGAPLRIATRSGWAFTPEAFADAVEAIVKAENRYWGDPGRTFFVPLAPLGGTDGGYSLQGSGRGDGFSLASTSAITLPQIAHVLAHEYMHTWNSAELGSLSQEGEALGYWFSEGFTDFQASRVLLAAGLWTPAQYAEELNAVLARYAASPGRTASNADVAARFWTDPAWEKMPYDRGHLLALLLDERIRRETAGRADLDDVMRAQLARARRDGENKPWVDAARLFPLVAREGFGVDVAPEIARYADRGEAVMLPADLFGACAVVETRTQPDFDRGFDIAATQAANLVLTGVDSTGAAYAAGMRDGMRLIRREGGTPGDAGVEYVYRVDDGGTERVLRYFPAGKGSITVQRVVLSPDAPATCAATMSGASG